MFITFHSASSLFTSVSFEFTRHCRLSEQKETAIETSHLVSKSCFLCLKNFDQQLRPPCKSNCKALHWTAYFQKGLTEIEEATEGKKEGSEIHRSPRDGTILSKDILSCQITDYRLIGIFQN